MPIVTIHASEATETNVRVLQLAGYAVVVLHGPANHVGLPGVAGVFTQDDADICLQAAEFFRKKDGITGPDADWFVGLGSRIQAVLNATGRS